MHILKLTFQHISSQATASGHCSGVMTFMLGFIKHLDIVAMLRSNDQPCWLAQACKSLLLLLLGVQGGGGSSPVEPGNMLWLIQRDFLEGKTVQAMVSEALQPVPNPEQDQDIAQVCCSAGPSHLVSLTRQCISQ